MHLGILDGLVNLFLCHRLDFSNQAPIDRRTDFQLFSRFRFHPFAVEQVSIDTFPMHGILKHRKFLLLVLGNSILSPGGKYTLQKWDAI